MAICKDCLHNPVCDLLRSNGERDAASFQLSGCDHFKDRSRFVEVPCRVGDLVWVLRSYHGVKHPQQGRVSELILTPNLRLMISVKHIARGEWGKEVFATCEEAEKALVERRNDG